MRTHHFPLRASQQLNSIRFLAKAAVQLLTTLLLFSLCLFPNIASAATPHIYDAPNAGPPGSHTTTVGNGFDPNATLDIYFDSTDVGLVVTDSNGSFGRTLPATAIRQNGFLIQISKDAVPGQHWITAVERITQLQAQAPFTVWTDWPQFHYGPDRTGLNPYESVLSPGTVGNLTTRWTYPIGGYVSTGATAANGAVYSSSKWGPICALNAGTGALLWISSFSGTPYTGPAVVNGILYTNSGYGVYALDAFTGVPLWNYPIGNTGFGEQVAVANGVVYVGSALDGGNPNNYFYAVDASSGTLRWKYPTGTNFFFASPAVADGVVYAGDYSGNLYALDAGTGALRWKFPMPSGIDAAPVVANGVVYVVPGQGDVYALNASTGAPIWEEHVAEAFIFGPPAVANGVLYAASGDGNVYALNSSTGTLQWQFAAGDAIISSPAVANGVVYFGSFDANFYAVEASTGALLWKYKTGGPEVESSPTVVNGMLYIGSDDGNLYAFGLPSQQMTEKFSPPERPDPALLTPNWSLQPNTVVTPVEK